MSSLDFPTTNGTSVATQSTRFLHLLDFLNSSRSGSAQNEYGISFEAFFTSLTLTLIYCVCQASAFSLIREHFKNIYQPNCYYVPDDEKVPTLKDNLLAWLNHVVWLPLDDYKNMGLDAYLFLRFIWLILVMFIGLAALNIPILIPINYTSGYDKYTDSDRLSFTNGTTPVVKGLDRISMSNISPKYTSRYSVHLTMAIITILWFHGLIINELFNFVKIKNNWLVNNSDYLKSKLHERDHSNTILIDNVPVKLLNSKGLNKLFSEILGSTIKNIWFVYDYKDMKLYYSKHLSLIEQIETLESEWISNNHYNELNNKVALKHQIRAWLRHLLNYRIQFKKKFIPTLTYKKLTDQLNDLTNEFVYNYHLLQNKRNRLVLRESSPMKDHKFNKVFIQFEDSLDPDILNQIQISDKLNLLDKTIIRVNPKDIIWENLSTQSNMLTFLRLLGGNILACLVILLWVIPVSFVGLFSQIPYISRLIPFLGWLRLLPEYITDVISNLLSVVLLLCLMEMAPSVMRFLGFIKCKRTGAEIEIDVQKWMFVFSFIHVFMVVTVTSGFTVLVEGFLNNPISIPDILANNLPKCANFFFSYLMIRGISYFGNNLLQNYQLFQNLFIYDLIDLTPRQKFRRLSTIPSYKYGSLYSSFALLASIGIIYSVLSPLIIVFVLIAFTMALVSFKYSIKFQFSHKNYSETFGDLYPRALFHLYTGVYVLELCLIGIFASSKDENDQSNCLYHALLTFGILVTTITGQLKLKAMFDKFLNKNLPMTLHKVTGNSRHHDPKITQEEKNRMTQVSTPLQENTLFNDTFYEKCFQHDHTIIWLPNDKFGCSAKEVEYLKNLGIDASNEFNRLNDDGEILLNNCPPDYVEW